MSDRTPPSDDRDREDAVLSTYEWDDGLDPSVQLVEAVADATDCDATALPTLHDAVDVDAMNEVLSGTADGDDVYVAFEYANRSVEICSDGTITVGS